MQVLKSLLSLFYLGLAKTLVNKYASAQALKPSIKHIIYTLQNICAYKTKVTVTNSCCDIPENTVQTLNKVYNCLECPLFNQNQGNSIFFERQSKAYKSNHFPLSVFKKHCFFILINFNHFSKALGNQITSLKDAIFKKESIKLNETKLSVPGLKGQKTNFFLLGMEEVINTICWVIFLSLYDCYDQLLFQEKSHEPSTVLHQDCCLVECFSILTTALISIEPSILHNPLHL